MQKEVNFISINRKQDWENGVASNLNIVDEGISLKYTEEFAVSRTVCPADAGITTTVKDFVAGGYGFLYLLDVDANIWWYDYQNQQAGLFFKAGHGMFTQHAVITLWKDTLFVADPAGEWKVAAFSLLNGQLLWSLNECEGMEIFPLAMAVGEGRQNLYVAVPLDITYDKDRIGEVPQGGRLGIVKINASGMPVNIFQDSKLYLKEKAELLRLKDKLYMAVSQEELVYLLNAQAGVISGFSTDGTMLVHFPVKSEAQLSGLGIDAHGDIYLGDSRRLAPGVEDDRFVMIVNSPGDITGLVDGYRGRADKLILDNNQKMYIWNGETFLVTVMEPEKKTAIMGESGFPRGIYLSGAIDCRLEQACWHKILLEAQIPENTQVKIAYFASDKKSFLMNGRNQDLDEYIRDRSISFQEKLHFLESFWHQSILNPEDALFHGARGRFLWFKIELVGSDEGTPVLKTLRLYYPRISYLRYLPAVYQDDKKSSEFLERFLSLFETFFSNMDEKIDNAAGYFDADSVSGKYLKWLASWLAVSVDDSWNEEQVRRLIKRSPELYKKRGTREGIAEIIEVFTGEKPFIVEYFQYKELLKVPELQNLLSRLYSVDPYCFCVFVKADCVPTERQRLTLQKLLQDEKPAFTMAKLVILQSWIYLDMHSYLGINTYLSEHSVLRLDQESYIPNNAVVIDVDRNHRLGIHSRTELDSSLQ
ncbi:MAG: hypothetical protein FH756_17980 [Firmicutes bacterium]|nr:hypothetical protein [Bacillota bacterium]